MPHSLPARQLLLDLGAPPSPTFRNFVETGNEEVHARLQALAAALATSPDALSPADRTLYIWGAPGTGRSHLLHAVCQALPPGSARLLGAHSPLHAFEPAPEVLCYGIDDCEALSPAAQIAAFNLFNETRAGGSAALVVTGSAAPLHLAVRDDLRTRLGWGLVYQLAPLADAGKIVALTRAAKERGLALAADVPDYLLNHFARDMPHLMAVLDALDRFSLERHRAVTVPLLRAMLASAAAPDNAQQALGRF
ncbi:MAG: DnaA regulatory inactivator Hda [Janthinobacterium lividum]